MIIYWREKMEEEHIVRINQDPKILIQQILGKALHGTENRITINIFIIGNTGDTIKVESGKQITQESEKELKEAGTKYHITKGLLAKALEANNWNKMATAKELDIPYYTVIQLCSGWKLMQKPEGGGY